MSDWVGLQPDRVAATRRLARSSSSVEQAATDAVAVGVGGDPHPLELGRLSAVELEGARADRLTMQCGDEEQPGRAPQLVDLGGQAARQGRSRRRSVDRARRSTASMQCWAWRCEGVDGVDVQRGAAVSSSSTWYIAATIR